MLRLVVGTTGDPCSTRGDSTFMSLKREHPSPARGIRARSIPQSSLLYLSIATIQKQRGLGLELVSLELTTIVVARFDYFASRH